MNKTFEYQSNGIRKTMCSRCPHEYLTINDMDVEFIEHGHSHRCHMDGDKEIACRGVCEKAKILGYTLTVEGD
ncbi:hypothetical protein [Staphylococcus simulans]|uniref:hypothetical protein n=1 Tax=Staphylococcus simulans TaxID=1286 RepID=UPI000D0285D1|nr:hypothetical protein [Staphylococcus simulans]